MRNYYEVDPCDIAFPKEFEYSRLWACINESRTFACIDEDATPVANIKEA